MIALSNKEARQLAVRHQFLGEITPKKGSRLERLQRVIEQLGYVQIDTISVVQRAHEHTLWTRMPDYKAQLLNDLQVKERKVFEYWSHAAAYLPLCDYRYCLPRMLDYRSGKKHWLNPDKKVIQWVLDRIENEGALMARDFKAPADHKGGTWWSWKPAKAALEQLFMEGRLMISHRKGFQKVYDLAERVLPSGVDTAVPSEKEYIRYLIEATLRAHGLATAREMRYLRRGTMDKVKEVLAEMLEEKILVTVKMETDSKEAYYVKPDYLEQTLTTSRREKALHILCPFDNLIIQRKRAAQLFDFAYKLECYVPEAKRVVGYYAMPILWGDVFMGQLDMKADRKGKELVIKQVVWEEHSKLNEAFRAAFNKKMIAYMQFNDCETIKGFDAWKIKA